MTEILAYGQLLRKIRETKGMCLKDIAEVLHCSVAYVSDVERGTRAPFSDADARKIAKFLAHNEEDMLYAAHRSKSRFVLDAKNASEVKKNLGARLIESWESMTDETAKKVIVTIGH